MSDKKRNSFDLDDVPQSGGRDLPKNPKIGDLLEMANLGPKFKYYRFLGPVVKYSAHWIDVKKQDGSSTSFPSVCLNFDYETGEQIDGGCPWCRISKALPKPAANQRKAVRPDNNYFVNVIDRAIQEKLGKDQGSPSDKELEERVISNKAESEAKTPVRVLRLTQGTLRALQGLRELNVHREDGRPTTYSISHPVYGADFAMKYDKEAAGSAKYPLQIGEKTALTKAETRLLQWDLSHENLFPHIPDLKDMVAEAKSWIERNAKKLGILDALKESGEVDDLLGSTSRSSHKSDEDEEDDDYKPASRKKQAARSEEDEDEAPRRKKPPVDDDEDEEPAPRRKKPPVEDDEDEEPAPRRKKPPVEDDEDEEPAPRRKKPPVEDDEDEAPPPRRKKPPVEDDEDEEPAPRRKKPPVEDEDEEPTPRRKKPPVEDDEEDF